MSGTILNRFLLRPPADAESREQVPGGYHLIDPSRTPKRLPLRDASAHVRQFALCLRFIHPPLPPGRPLNWPRAQRNRAPSRLVVPTTPPAPLLGSRYQPRPHRVAIVIPADGQEMRIVLDHKGLDRP